MFQRVELKLFEDGAIVAARLAAGRAAATVGGASAPRAVAFVDVGRAVGAKWKALPEPEKARYNARYADDKRAYDAAVRRERVEHLGLCEPAW